MGKKGKKRKTQAGEEKGSGPANKNTNKNKKAGGDSADSELPDFKTANDKFLYLVKHEIGTDCEFIVGSTKKVVKAHKLILSTSSKVFEKMFSGQFKDAHCPVIIKDADPVYFRNFIYYLYSDVIDITNILQAQSYFDLANKYNIPRLMEKSTNFIVKHVTASNVLEVLSFAELYNTESVLKACRDVIATNSQKIINDQSFLKASMQAVKFIVSMEGLSVPEYKLLEGISNWTLEEFIRQEIYGDEFKEQQMAIYDNFMPHIKFESMTAEELVECKAAEKMLRPEIFCQILKHLISPTIIGIPDGYATGERVLKMTNEFCYYQKFSDFILKSATGDEDVYIHPTKCLKIEGVVLSGNFSNIKNEKYEEFIHVHIQGPEIDIHGTFAGRTPYNSFIHIYFDEPIVLKKQNTYSINIKMIGPSVYLAGQVLNKAFKNSKVYLIRDELSHNKLNLCANTIKETDRKYSRLFAVICERKRHLIQL